MDQNLNLDALIRQAHAQRNAELARLLGAAWESLTRRVARSAGPLLSPPPLARRA